MRFKLLFLIITLSNALLAQDKAEISGQIKDSKTKESLEFCSVNVYNGQKKMVIGGVSDENGFFTLPVDGGNYYLIIRCIGYKTDTTQPFDVAGKSLLEAREFFGRRNSWCAKFYGSTAFF